jgi:glycosyltransferase involved in cell wall biosynthesis
VTDLVLDAPRSERLAPIDRRQIRVLHILWTGGLGGAERAVYRLVREQRNAGDFEPALFYAQSVGPFVERARELGCPVIEPRLSSNRSVHRLPALARLMGGYDVHHFHSAEPLLMAASLRSSAAARVYTHRGGLPEYSLAKRLRLELCGALLRRSFHAYSGNTGHGARCGAALFRLSGDRFRVTYNGLDFGLIEPVRPAVAVRDELSLHATDFVLGTAAVLKQCKRIERLVQLLADVHDPRLHLLVVGDGEERVQLEALARALGVAERARFIGRRDRPWDYFQVMDAFSLPSGEGESFGNAAVEAMALGLPTIVFSDGGGLLEHVEHDRTGFVVSTRRELEQTVAGLMADRGRCVRIGESARAAIRDRYTTDRAVRAYRDLYEEALRAAAAE